MIVLSAPEEGGGQVVWNREWMRNLHKQSPPELRDPSLRSWGDSLRSTYAVDYINEPTEPSWIGDRLRSPVPHEQTNEKTNPLYPQDCCTFRKARGTPLSDGEAAAGPPLQVGGIMPPTVTLNLRLRKLSRERAEKAAPTIPITRIDKTKPNNPCRITCFALFSPYVAAVFEHRGGRPAARYTSSMTRIPMTPSCASVGEGTAVTTHRRVRRRAADGCSSYRLRSRLVAGSRLRRGVIVS